VPWPVYPDSGGGAYSFWMPFRGGLDLLVFSIQMHPVSLCNLYGYVLGSFKPLAIPVLNVLETSCIFFFLSYILN